MSRKVISLRVLKMREKRGIYFSKEIYHKLNIEEGSYIEIKIRKGSKEYSYIAKSSQILSLRKEVISYLGLSSGDIIQLEIKKFLPMKRRNRLFTKKEIDMLALIPERTGRDFPIILKEFKVKSDKFLNIWCHHIRGSCSQIRLRRFLNPNIFGKLLGQLQAEGTKNNPELVEFSNNSFLEHKDFIDYLNYIGITKEEIIVNCTCHASMKNIEEQVEKFHKITSIRVKYVSKSINTTFNLGFHSLVRSVIFSAIMKNALARIRAELVKGKWSRNLRNLADGFFSKALTGDGNVDIDIKNRNLPQARLKIVDVNLEHLQEYKKIMEQYGLTPKLDEKYINVRSQLNIASVKKLLSIGAFKNNPNEQKLKLFLESREHSK